MRFNTASACIGFAKEWGDQYTKGEWILAIAMIHLTSFNKWKFDRTTGMFFYPAKQISFSYLAKSLPMCASTAHQHCTSLGNSSRPFFIELVKQTGRGGLFNIWCALTENQRAEASGKNENYNSAHRESESRSSEAGEQVTGNQRHIKNLKNSNSPQMEEEGRIQSLRFVPSDPFTKEFLPFKQIDGWANMANPDEREFIEPHPECEQTLTWMFRSFNSWFGLGPPERRTESRRLSDTQCQKILDLFEASGMDEADEPEFVKECIREFETAAAKGDPWRNVYKVLKSKLTDPPKEESK